MFPVCPSFVGFPSTCSSLLSSQAGHPLKHLSAGETCPRCPPAPLRVLVQRMRPAGLQELLSLIRTPSRATLCPQPSTQGTQIPCPPPRRHSPPHRPQTQDSPSHSPPLPAALWTPTQRKRQPVRRQYGQKVIQKLQYSLCVMTLCLRQLIAVPSRSSCSDRVPTT